jgi:hypothetical protein
MMGERTVMQEALFYGFSLEDHVPRDHLLRSIDRFVDLGGIREHLPGRIGRQTFCTKSFLLPVNGACRHQGLGGRIEITPKMPRPNEAPFAEGQPGS